MSDSALDGDMFDRMIPSPNTGVADSVPSCRDATWAYTIVTRNHFHLAAGLAAGVLERTTSARLLIVVADATDPISGETSWEWLSRCHASWKPKNRGTWRDEGRVQLCAPIDLGITDWQALALQYEPLELTCSLKPLVAQTLLANGIQRFLYLDADTRLYDSLDHCLRPLDSQGGVLLTPHLRRALPDDTAFPSDKDLLRSGTFNAGVFGVNSREEIHNDIIAFFDWWATKCRRECIVDPHQGLFVDQKWLDQAIGMFPCLRTATGLGLNVGYWNLHERRVLRQAGASPSPRGSGQDYRVVPRSQPSTASISPDAEPLQVFHFSGAKRIDADGQSLEHRLSVHQNRHRLVDHPAVEPLLREYFDSWESNAWKHYQSIPYLYATWSDGSDVTPRQREAYRLNAGDLRHSVLEPWRAWATPTGRENLDMVSSADTLRGGRFQYHLDALNRRIESLKKRLDRLPWRRLAQATRRWRHRWFRHAG
jgi:hypothetical protein